jgi:Flp pilus assembly protein TadD
MISELPVRSHPRRPRFHTAASVLALALGLTACAGGAAGPHGNTAQSDVKSATLLKIADETAATDPATAASLYRQLHDSAPRDPVPLGRLASVFMTLQDYRSAAIAYRAAIALSPDDVDFHRGLALADLVLGDPGSAMTEARGALAKHADDPRLYSVLGVAQDMTGQHDLAQQSYRHGLELSPANIGLRNNFGMSLALAGDYGDAVTKLAEIAGPDGAPRYRLNLALAYGLAGDDAKAAATARQVLDEQAVQNNLAFYALLRGMTEQQRNAAIIGSELHGGGLPPVEVAAKKPPLPDAVAAAPQSPVSQAALAPPTVINEPLPPSSPATAAPAPDKLAKATPRSEPMKPAPVTPLPPAPPAASPVASAPPVPLTPAAAAPEASAPAMPAPTQDDVTASSDRPAPVPVPAAVAPTPVDLKPQSSLAPLRIAAPEIADLNDVVLDLATAEPVAVPASAPADIDPPAAPAPAEEVTVTAPAVPAAVTIPAAAVPATADRYTIQLGSYMFEASARHDADVFTTSGVPVTMSRANGRDGREWFVLRTQPVANSDDAQSVLEKMRSLGAVGPLVLHQRGTDPSA